MAKVKNAPAGEVLEVEAEEIHEPVVRSVEDAILQDIVVFDKYAARVSELKSQYGSVKINGVEDKEGYEGAKVAVRELRTTRTGTEADRKAAKEFYLNCGRAIDKKAAEIETFILELETPIKAQIKEIDDEKDRLRVERIEKEKERFWGRVNRLKELGAVYNMGVVSLDALEFSEATVRESDDDYFENKIVPQFKEIFDQKELIRIAHEKAKQEEERLAQEERDRFAEQQRKLKEQQDELDRQTRELEKKRFAAQQDRTKKRSLQLTNFGMVFSFVQSQWILGRVSITLEEVEQYTDERWDDMIALLTPDIEETKKQIQADKQAEQDRLNKEAIEREENRKRQEDELRRQQELRELEEGKDLDRWLFFLKSLPKEFPVMKSGQYSNMVEQAKEKIEYIRSLKATSKGVKSVI